MKKDAFVLVTGGTGFAGSQLLRLLVQEGWRVRALRRASSSMRLVQDVEHQVEWAVADVTDIVALEDAFEGITHVCHGAAMVSFHPRDARQMMQINVEGTANVVNLALDFGVKKLIHISSIAAIGRTKNSVQVHEKDLWVPGRQHGNYAISKFLGEQEAWRGHFEGVPTAIVNPAVILGDGPWDTGSGRFFKHLYKGMPFCPIGRTGFVDVRDVARFMVLLLESDIAGERFILNAQNMSYNDFFRATAAALGVRPPSLQAGAWLTGFAWRVEWLKEKLLGLPPMVTQEGARASLSQVSFSNAKSLTLPGFAYHPLEQTIKETAEAFLKSKRAAGEG